MQTMAQAGGSPALTSSANVYTGMPAGSREQSTGRQAWISKPSGSVAPMHATPDAQLRTQEPAGRTRGLGQPPNEPVDEVGLHGRPTCSIHVQRGMCCDQRLQRGAACQRTHTQAARPAPGLLMVTAQAAGRSPLVKARANHFSTRSMLSRRRACGARAGPLNVCSTPLSLTTCVRCRPQQGVGALGQQKSNKRGCKARARTVISASS